MAKDSPKPTSRSNSAFRKFEALARKIVRAPKGDKPKRKSS